MGRGVHLYLDLGMGVSGEDAEKRRPCWKIEVASTPKTVVYRGVLMMVSLPKRLIG